MDMSQSPHNPAQKPVEPDINDAPTVPMTPADDSDGAPVDAPGEMWGLDAYPEPYYPPTTPMLDPTTPLPAVQPAMASASGGSGPARMPKAQAHQLVKRIKQGVAAGSVVAFGVLTALASSHVTGATAKGSAAPSQQSSGSGAQQTPTTTSSGAQGGFSSQNDQGSAGFGSSAAPVYQPPATNTSVS